MKHGALYCIKEHIICLFVSLPVCSSVTPKRKAETSEVQSHNIYSESRSHKDGHRHIKMFNKDKNFVSLTLIPTNPRYGSQSRQPTGI